MSDKPEDAAEFSALRAPRMPSVASHIERSRYWSRHLGHLGLTALIYGAVELRMGIESALVQMLVRVRGSDLSESDVKALRSAKSLQARIYELEGHQRILDRKLEFLALLLEVAGAPAFPLARLNAARAFNHWQALSDLCHFVWPWNDEMVNQATQILADAEAFLEPIGSAMIVWPTYHEDWIRQLEDEFVEGAISPEQVRKQIQERGAWGLVTAPDGSKHFASEMWGADHE
jgi:hypothetical protein